MLNGGCWIFLSHSSHDIEKVRIVRNEFEKLGHNPLAFHLKCLSSDTDEGRRELDSLIKREIDAREWFVFCESPNAKNSPYVRNEHAYIINSGKENVWEIDMTDDIESILDKVRKICADIEVYISYTHSDYSLIQPLINALVEKDYAVWGEEDIVVGKYVDLQQDAIKRCAYKGFYIIVITQESINSLWVMKELEYASSLEALIIPIVMGQPDMPSYMESLLAGKRFFSVEKLTEEEIIIIISYMNDVVKNRINNNILSSDG